MSYKHLAGRLIETQRSMLGEPALEIARSVDGLGVESDGTVTAVDGDGRAVVDELASKYTDMMGSAAEDRLVAAAREFESELALPPSLGGPEIEDAPDDIENTGDDAATDEASADAPAEGDPDAAPERPDEDADPATPGESTDATDPDTPGESTGGTDPATPEGPSPPAGPMDGDGNGSDRRPVGPRVAEPGATVSDGGTVGPAGSGGGGGNGGGVTEVVSPTPGYGPGAFEDAAGSASDTDDGAASTLTVPEPVTFGYDVASDLDELDSAGELAAAYLLPVDGDGWQAPVRVDEAVIEAVASAADTPPDAVADVPDELDAERVFETLSGEGDETVSFSVRGITVTFHRSGSLAVH